MNRIRFIHETMGAVFLTALLILVCNPCLADYRKALPGYEFSFPRDHYSHPDFAIEWWYYTGHLFTSNGRRFGFELTFFRKGVPNSDSAGEASMWKVRDIFFAHLAITDVSDNSFHYFEKMHRGLSGVAFASVSSFDVKNGKWRLWGSPERQRMRAAKAGYGIDLMHVPVHPPVIHGYNGVSQKGEGEGHASHYYSFTRLKTEGTITVNGKNYRVSGTSWMDHEFSSDQLAPDQVGWDWFSLQLENDYEIMLYMMRKKDGTVDPHSSGTLIKKGIPKHLNVREFRVVSKGRWKSRKSGAVYPSGWEVVIMDEKLRLKIVPLVKDQELITTKSTQVTYWEGACRVSGRLGKEKIRGSAYVELAGYAGSLSGF